MVIYFEKPLQSKLGKQKKEIETNEGWKLG